jgi:hypothetical protein
MEKKQFITVYVTRPQHQFLEEQKKSSGLSYSGYFLTLLNAHIKEVENEKRKSC